MHTAGTSNQSENKVEIMNRTLRNTAALFAAMLLCGCLSYQYEGEKAAEPTEKVQLYTDSTRINRSYTVLGRATVSGNYQEVSTEKMTKKLVEEAKKCGANAILITGQQVIPVTDGFSSSSGVFMTAFDYDDTNQSWSQLYKDVDLRYGSIRKRNSTPAAASPKHYKRVVRAEFLRFSAKPAADGAAGKAK